MNQMNKIDRPVIGDNLRMAWTSDVAAERRALADSRRGAEVTVSSSSGWGPKTTW